MTSAAPTVLQVIRAAAEVSGIGAAQIVGDSGDRQLGAIRIAVCVVCRDYGYSLNRIGRRLQRHHTTVLHYLDRHAAQPDAAAGFLDPIRTVAERLHKRSYP